MSPRLTRAFQALSTVELDEKSRFGALGEFHMQQVLDDEQLLYVFNPIVPIPGKPGRFNESDFLIYAYGSLFCVEIKNWRGSVYYPPANWAFGARFNGPPDRNRQIQIAILLRSCRIDREDMVPQFTRIPYKKLRLSLVGSNDF
jgi:hypothetical protein